MGRKRQSKQPLILYGRKRTNQKVHYQPTFCPSRVFTAKP
jgi:hypothetical protein